MVYAIMLLDVRDYSFTRRFSWLLLPGAVAAIAFVAILAHGFWQALPEPAAAGASPLFGVARFSIEFLNEYWLHFELVSVLLVAAVVAALAVLEVGRRDRG
jgi:NADH-quinone oxidoreductase subunit J